MPACLSPEKLDGLFSGVISPKLRSRISGSLMPFLRHIEQERYGLVLAQELDATIVAESIAKAIKRPVRTVTFFRFAEMADCWPKIHGRLGAILSVRLKQTHASLIQRASEGPIGIGLESDLFRAIIDCVFKNLYFNSTFAGLAYNSVCDAIKCMVGSACAGEEQVMNDLMELAWVLSRALPIAEDKRNPNNWLVVVK